jgi:hypothetical protein
MHNGGYPLRTGIGDENSPFEWWYRDPAPFQPDYSLTWSMANWLNVYFAQYPSEFDVNPPSALEGGDLIILDLHGASLDDAPDSIPDHARAVVGYGDISQNQNDYTRGGCAGADYPIPTPNPSPILLINQHCVDRWHVAWDYNLLDEHQKWFIHIID